MCSNCNDEKTDEKQWERSGCVFARGQRGQRLLYGPASFVRFAAVCKCNDLFTYILYGTGKNGIFRCLETELVPFSCFKSLLVAKYNSFICTN